MDKGIRPFAIAKFIEAAPTRVNDRAGNTAFRKGVIATLMEEFGITLASAATHYNHAFISAKTTHPQLVEGLGRPEDKKGGRKPKPKAVPAATEAVTVGEVLESNLIDNGDEMTGTEVPESTLLSEGVKENTSTLTVTVNPEPMHAVRKVSDGTVVCENLTLEQAKALIAKAASAKKAKLELVA